MWVAGPIFLAQVKISELIADGTDLLALFLRYALEFPESVTKLLDLAAGFLHSQVCFLKKREYFFIGKGIHGYLYPWVRIWNRKFRIRSREQS